MKESNVLHMLLLADTIDSVIKSFEFGRACVITRATNFLT